MKIIYIAGYSRSGSTILDLLLSSHKDFFGTGELAYLFDDWQDETRFCTCGQLYKNCSFWGDFKLPGNMEMSEAVDTIRRVESRKFNDQLAEGTIPQNILANYQAIQKALYEYIFSHSGARFVVDSSKTSRDMAGRFYALQEYIGAEVYVIHLVKDGLSIVESYVKKGRNWALEGYGKDDFLPATRSSMGWKLANSIAERFGKKMGDRYMMVRYEDLLQQPRKVLQQLGQFLSVDMSEVIANAENAVPLPIKHNVGGNRLRLDKEVKFRAVNSETIKSSSLSAFYRIIFKIVTGGLNKRYGYQK